MRAELVAQAAAVLKQIDGVAQSPAPPAQAASPAAPDDVEALIAARRKTRSASAPKTADVDGRSGHRRPPQDHRSGRRRVRRAPSAASPSAPTMSSAPSAARPYSAPQTDPLIQRPVRRPILRSIARSFSFVVLLLVLCPRCWLACSLASPAPVGKSSSQAQRHLPRSSNRLSRFNLPSRRPSAAAGAALYQEKCVRCHGERGRGDGVMAGQIQSAIRQPGVRSHFRCVGARPDAGGVV